MNELMKMHFESKRREFLRGSVLGLGGIALGSLLGCGNKDSDQKKVKEIIEDSNKPLVNPHFLPKAKRVIYLFQSGGPSQMELFDYKPMLYKMHGQEIPASVIGKTEFLEWLATNTLFHWPCLLQHLSNMDQGVDILVT